MSFSNLQEITGTKAVQSRTYVFSYKPFVQEVTQDEIDFLETFPKNEKDFMFEKLGQFVKENSNFDYFSISINRKPKEILSEEIENDFGYDIYFSVEPFYNYELPENDGWC